MDFISYINNDFSPIAVEASVKQVKDLFKVLPFTHFPIVEDNTFKGMIGQADIINLLDNETPIGELSHLLQNYHTDFDTNVLDLLSLFAQEDTDIIPVINDSHEYIGYFELDEIIRLFYKTPFLTSNGTTLIIAKQTGSFSMSEIAQIIESNNIKILGLYISDAESDGKTEITLRIETENINEVIQSLRRYEYELLSKKAGDLLIEQLKERSDYLQKYLEI
ncbi:MAG: acetoin utilization protein acuB [Flavobacteriales bacterium]|nr:MAG: acetoin utilization protein acuB [Flavobacteriales bacterium]